MVNATSLYANPNVTNFVKFFEYGNYVTDNMFVNIGLGIFWVVCFFAMKRYETEKAFAASSFICLILSSLFRVAGLVNEYLVILFLLATAISIFFMKRD